MNRFLIIAFIIAAVAAVGVGGLTAEKYFTGRHATQVAPTPAPPMSMSKIETTIAERATKQIEMAGFSDRLHLSSPVVCEDRESAGIARIQ